VLLLLLDAGGFLDNVDTIVYGMPDARGWFRFVVVCSLKSFVTAIPTRNDRNNVSAHFGSSTKIVLLSLSLSWSIFGPLKKNAR
jgi:predicted CDP-diglyceride synthetase/phosphatidate cytidylyltransferase